MVIKRAKLNWYSNIDPIHLCSQHPEDIGPDGDFSVEIVPEEFIAKNCILLRILRQGQSTSN